MPKKLNNPSNILAPIFLIELRADLTANFIFLKRFWIQTTAGLARDLSLETTFLIKANSSNCWTSSTRVEETACVILSLSNSFLIIPFNVKDSGLWTSDNLSTEYGFEPLDFQAE